MVLCSQCTFLAAAASSVATLLQCLGLSGLPRLTARLIVCVSETLVHRVHSLETPLRLHQPSRSPHDPPGSWQRWWWPDLPGILLAGFLMSALLLPSLAALWEPYGELLIAKISGFAALMGLATLNEWRFGPARRRRCLARGRRLSAGRETRVHTDLRRACHYSHHDCVLLSPE